MTPDTIDTPDESLCLLLGTDANGSEVQVPRCNDWPSCVCGGPEGEKRILAAKDHELTLMRKALDWCLKYAAYNTAAGVVSARGPFLEAVPIPEDIAEIVNSRQP